jgi:hypothetical protein
MKVLRNIATAALLSLAIGAQAKYKMNTTYMYGFAASFNDSTVYFTNVQKVDSAWFDTKTNFLYSRDNYSYQLRDFLASQGVPNRTCVVSFAKDEKTAQRKLDKMFTKYQKNQKNKGHFLIKFVDSKFSFKGLIPYEETEQGKNDAKFQEEKARIQKSEAEEAAKLKRNKKKQPRRPKDNVLPPQEQ